MDDDDVVHKAMKCPVAECKRVVRFVCGCNERRNDGTVNVFVRSFGAIGHNGQFGRIGSLFALLRRPFHPCNWPCPQKAIGIDLLHCGTFE